MKNFGIFLVMLVFLLALGLSLVSCESSDDTNSGNLDGGNNPSGGNNSHVVGTWSVTEADGFTVTLTFRADSSCTWVESGLGGGGGTSHGTYTVSGNMIWLTFSGVPTEGTISGNTLIYSGLTFTRVSN